MDPYKVLGISERSLTNDDDLAKLRKKCKEQYRELKKKHREADAKRIQDAFEDVRRKFEKERKVQGPEKPPEPQPGQPAADAPDKEPDAGGGRKRSAKELREQETLARREAIREKAAIRRADIDAEARRAMIREKLAAKRQGLDTTGVVQDLSEAPDRPLPDVEVVATVKSSSK